MSETIELTDEVFSEIVDLAGAMREGTIENIDVVRLDQLLTDCPGAVEVYAELALLTTDLNDVHGQISLVAPPSPPPRRFNPMAIFAVAAAAAIMAVGMLWTQPPTPAPFRGEVVTTASGVYDAAFVYGGVDGAAISSGDELRSGPYQLTDGILELSYGNGATVIIEAPASFTLETDMLLVLNDGNLSARVPATAIGFTVDTAAAKVVDLGTEFSVRASPTTSEVHVFEGEVVVESNAAEDEKPLHLFKDQASRIDTSSGLPVGIDVQPDDFLRVLDEPKHVYPRQLRKLQPVAYYRMRPSDKNVLDDFVAGQHNGIFVSGKGTKAMWAPGRYGAAFRSEGPGCARYALVSDFPVPEDLTVSIVAWVKAESRPSLATIVGQLAPEGKELLHFGLDEETGHLSAQLRNSTGKPVRFRADRPFKLEEWQHVALTSDGQTARLYINGDEVARTTLSTESWPAVKTDLTIGARYAGSRLRRIGTWDGRLDEVAIFHRALTADEIGELYDIHPVD